MSNNKAVLATSGSSNPPPRCRVLSAAEVQFVTEMIMSESTQLAVLLASTVAIFSILMLAALINRWRRTYGMGSARFITACASTNLSKKLKGVLRPGDEILMPAGKGLYPCILKDAARLNWENEIERWTTIGIRFTLIITTPNETATRYWQNLASRCSPNLRVFVLDRKFASSEDAIEIERLDKFHPTLILRGEQPLGMWLENHHDDSSRVAYNIEYVAAEDIVEYQLARFSRLLGVLRRLTDETRRPPHLMRLSCGDDAASAASNTMRAA
jgi:hypothetical protein